MQPPIAAPKKRSKTPDQDNARGQRRVHVARLAHTPAATTAVIPAKKTPEVKKPRGTDVRERVLQAALECFGAFGFEGTSTRAVAERAGVSHPLLLYHFDSKDKLWLSTMEAVIGEYQRVLAERLAQTDRQDAAAGLRAFVDHFVRFSARVPQLHRIMTQESTQGSERIHWLIDTHLRESFKAVLALIRKGQRAGCVREGDPARLYYAIVGLGGTLLSVSSEFRMLTQRDVFTEKELRHTIEFIDDVIFIEPQPASAA